MRMEIIYRSINNENYEGAECLHEHLQIMLDIKEVENYATSGNSYCSGSPINSDWALSKTYMQVKDGVIE